MTTVTRIAVAVAIATGKPSVTVPMDLSVNLGDKIARVGHPKQWYVGSVTHDYRPAKSVTIIGIEEVPDGS